MGESDKAALREGFDAAANAVGYACDQGWYGAHLLARADKPGSAFDPDDPEEREWWREVLGSFADRVARLPIVDTTEGRLPATTPEGAYADLILPRLLAASPTDETRVLRMWPLVDEASELFPPLRDVAEAWSRIADGWSALGVETQRVTLEVLAAYAKGEASKVTELRVTTDPHDWLSRYVDVVGECWERRHGVDDQVLVGLLPNQNGVLRSPSDLRIDRGVPDELKDICELAGLDVRDGLLSITLLEAIETASLEYAGGALTKAIPTTVTGHAARDELIVHLGEVLPEDVECSAANEPLQRASAQLLGYLWRTAGPAAEEAARKVPLVTASRKVVRWSPERLMMAPVHSWGEAARPFSAAYPADRILHDLYTTSDGAVVAALGTWGMAYPDPVIKSSPAELTGSRLAAIVSDFDSAGVTVRNEEFSQIALLPREVINHIQDPGEAAALLGLVLCHVARNDPAWRDTRVLKGTKAREVVEVPLRGALWLADLRSRAWIPVRGEDDKPFKAVAEVATLKPLLDPSWLEANEPGIALLTECFEFDELDLRLLGIAPEMQARVRHGLARLLESGGADPELYESLAEEVEARQRRQRDMDRSRRMGYAVQRAVKEALEEHGLAVRLVDRGFDYEVRVPAVEDALSDVSFRFEVGPYLVEVKATTTGPVRLTPAQASMAAGHASEYVLCVVDLRGVTEDELDGEWSAAEVEPLASVLSDIGGRISETHVLVGRARDSQVGIRNESALRYEVPPAIWGTGVSIRDWVDAISAILP